MQAKLTFWRACTDQRTLSGPSAAARPTEAVQEPDERTVTSGEGPHQQREVFSRYGIRYVEIYGSARKHGIVDLDIEHVVDHALAIGEQDDGKVLYLGPDRAGNLLEVISVRRDDDEEIVIHAMRMRRRYEMFLRGGESDDD